MRWLIACAVAAVAGCGPKTEIAARISPGEVKAVLTAEWIVLLRGQGSVGEPAGLLVLGASEAAGLMAGEVLEFLAFEGTACVAEGRSELFEVGGEYEFVLTDKEGPCTDATELPCTFQCREGLWRVTVSVR